MTTTLPDTIKLCLQCGWEDVATINRMAVGSAECVQDVARINQMAAGSAQLVQ